MGNRQDVADRSAARPSVIETTLDGPATTVANRTWAAAGHEVPAESVPVSVSQSSVDVFAGTVKALDPAKLW